MKICLVISSDGPQTGKTTAAKFFADKFNSPYKSTSDVVTEFTAAKLGIQPQQILDARKSQPSAYRPELMAMGKELVDNNKFPACICFEQGYTIIEGVRWPEDIWQLRILMASLDRPIYHVHIEGIPKEADTTQKEDLRAMADIIIDNSGTLDQFLDGLNQVYRMLM